MLLIRIPFWESNYCMSLCICKNPIYENPLVLLDMLQSVWRFRILVLMIRDLFLNGDLLSNWLLCQIHESRSSPGFLKIFFCYGPVLLIQDQDVLSYILTNNHTLVFAWIKPQIMRWVFPRMNCRINFTNHISFILYKIGYSLW